jgi:hypothetical protein
MKWAYQDPERGWARPSHSTATRRVWHFWVWMPLCDLGYRWLTFQGSPNGVGTGYFLAQHKNQLGGNKVVSRITIFRADADDQPCLVFWVADRPETPVEGGAIETSGAGNVESRVVRRSADSRSVVREHVFRAKL